MGKRAVIVFKSESESTDLYADLLHENGFNPIFVPTLSFGFKNLGQLRAKLENPDNYAGIIFTSPRCVEAVCEALQFSELSGGWKMLHNYAVGEVTHNLALSSYELFTHGKHTGTGGKLAEFIIETFDGSKDLPFLLPCSNLATDTLLSKLITDEYLVDACEVYETKCNPDLKANMDRVLKHEENIEFLAFFSPSGVNCLADYFKAHNISVDAWKLIAIGPSTRRAMEQKGWTVYRTAERPSVEYLIKVLING